MADNNELYELTHTVENGEDNFEFDATEAASDLVVSPATFKLTHTRDGNTDEFDFGDGDTPGPTPTGDLSNGTVTFAEAVSRENITSGSTLSVLFSKIKKWFSDLKTVAFTGSYTDLSNTPQIPTVGNGTITITQGGVSKGSFGVNDTQDKTISLEAGGTGSAPEVTGSATVDDNTGTPAVTVNTTGSGTQADPYVLDFAFRNLKGATGEQGSPGTPGQDGSPGAPGVDGSSAYCSVSKVGSAATITCTDKNGTTTAIVSDGQNGQNGSNGQDGSDGTSAYCSVSKSGGVSTITCTDANGTTTAQVSDGTEVVANPSGTGSTDLTSLEVSGTVYNIPSGGGGGSVTMDELYSGTGTPNTITLAHAYTDYDFLMIQGINPASPGYLNSCWVYVGSITTGNNVGLSDDASFLWYTVTNATTLTKTNAVKNYQITKIIGIKF